MTKKTQKIDIEEIVSNIITKHDYSVVEHVAKHYAKTQAFNDVIQDVLTTATKEMILAKISTISDYFIQQFDKYFNNHINDITTQAVKEHIETNPKFTKIFNKNLKKYLEEMNFEQIMMEFFHGKKDLLMELMLKQMFQDRNKKED